MPGGNGATLEYSPLRHADNLEHDVPPRAVVVERRFRAQPAVGQHERALPSTGSSSLAHG